ncbi:hypothetical protein HZ992_15315 [Rhizobacter sp. AJA081-3]|jgi:hypothetical protein|uniref:hypothetical protein n=1 Tax=Rhizobacter sp. AJA081-3 TaxID=2753607 RepID=UPI001ADF7238|nr:hypothetical protein [Rhizobacter sp. AJA081-3]QTN21549.1 hypothetical protein HZ992_15315 [Rhizobacter sp. AJA081-3]
MPAHLAGAFVPAFATAMDHESAARAAVYALGRQGFLFQDIQGPIHQLDATRWNEYVQSTWPELAAHFPPQSEVVQMLGTESVFFGPFAGYESAGVAQ